MTSVTYKDTIKFAPPITGGIVVKVYDGDTITIAAKLPYDESPLYRFSVRLRGIDCAEIKTDNEDEKTASIHVRDHLSSMIMGKQVFLKNVGTDMYGRVLADVFINMQEESISDYLIRNNMAVPYFGGKKIIPESWVNLYKTSNI